MKKEEKLALWSGRIHAFQASGQSCKTWCLENQIPASTMGFWMRRLPTYNKSYVFQKETLNIYIPYPYARCGKYSNLETLGKFYYV